MMKVVRDVIATLIVAAIAVLYIDVVGGSSVGFIADARGVAATGLVFGLVACATAGESVTVSKPGVWRTIAGLLVALLVGAGIVTVITSSDVVLAMFMALLVLLWAGSTLHHLTAPGAGVLCAVRRDARVRATIPFDEERNPTQSSGITTLAFLVLKAPVTSAPNAVPNSPRSRRRWPRLGRAW